MKKIILSILGLCLVFALMGCGGSGSSSNNEKYSFKDMYLGVCEYGISIPLCDDNENIASYLWKGKTVQ